MANWITLCRFPLLILFLIALYASGPEVRLVLVPILFLLLMLDTVDGQVARARKQTSLLGSVLDIAADRAHELALWVAFCDLDLIPAAIPFIVIVRTTLTDSFRSIGVRQGEAPFDQYQGRLARFLVKSSWMRSSYGISKIVAFCGLTLALALRGFPEGSIEADWAPLVHRIFLIISWAAAAICVLRGLPVIIGSVRRYWLGGSATPKA
jgi:CDP-diacylglycerol--glycerol-3-phosphate 3-phosphatidyltransferase